MLNTFVVTSALTASLLLTPANGANMNVAGGAAELVLNQKAISSVSMDLNNRYPVESVSKGFKENILIALGYFITDNPNGIVLNPGDVFAFHNDVLPEFKDKKIITQESNFGSNTGYKAIAGLYGNGVCHLASLMNEGARQAGLKVNSPTSHSFAKIPGIDAKFGTSISTRNAGKLQNLYITNDFDFPVQFKFNLDGDNLVFSIVASPII